MTMSQSKLTDSWDSDKGDDEFNKAFGAAKDDFALL